MEYQVVAYLFPSTEQSMYSWETAWAHSMEAKNITAVHFVFIPNSDKAALFREIHQSHRVMVLICSRSDKRGMLIAMLDEGVALHEVVVLTCQPLWQHLLASRAITVVRDFWKFNDHK